MTTYALTGYRGKIGTLLTGRADFVPLHCDITNLHSIENALKETKPDYIINCAALSSIDDCESDEKLAIKVNVRGVHNLHKLFGAKVLTISSDHVFSCGVAIEKSYKVPINTYGWSKLGAEDVSAFNDGKVIRLSRTVSIEDKDISQYLMELYKGNEIQVPSFFTRNYTHRIFVADAIEYMVRNWNKMPQIVNYGSTEILSFFSFMHQVAEKFKLNVGLVQPRKEYLECYTPRPKHGGLKVDLAKKLGFPMYKISDTIQRLAEEAHV